MEHIANLDLYNNSMRMSMIDKAFFLDRIDPEVIVDFGCADGSMMKFIGANYPDIDVIGYDISEEQLERAREACPDGTFFSDWKELIEYLRCVNSDKIALVCNSVIHEVYSYGSPKSISEFWERVNSPIFKWVTIRDMMISRDPFSYFDTASVSAVRAFADSKQLSEFESHWGSISIRENFLHFLLKYRYKANWERELREDYLPVEYDDIVRYVKANVIYWDHFTLDFLRRKVKEDFGINLRAETHIKLIFERK